MRCIHYYILAAACAIFFMASCSSTRRVAKEIAEDSVGSVWKSGECLVASANIGIADAGGKDITVGGTLRMKRDDVIQLNATYILGIQVGAMEITRDSVLIVSRATKQYAVFGYQELSALLGRTLTFEDLQDIFWGEATDFEVKGISWKYGAFTELADGRRLPKNLEMSFSKGNAGLKLTLNTYSHKLEEGWATRTKFNTANYGRLSSGQIVKMLTLLIGH